MSIKSLLAKPFAKYEVNKMQKSIANPFDAQKQIFDHLISAAKDTKIGKDHNFGSIHTYDDFKKNVPIRDYEGLKNYIELIKNGQSNVLWQGLPKYFAKTSGTTSGVKYIPISKTSIKNQVKAARLALQYFIYESNQSKWVDGKMIFLQGSPAMDSIAGIPTGRLSGITYHEVPLVFAQK